jgi:holo-[acyl-carrier protein] synthase
MKGIGLDLCEITRFERILEKGDGFLRRYFTQEEQAYLAGRGNTAAQSAAAMFAAKEAFLKAVGVGIGGGIALSEIGVAHETSGQPAYVLTGAAREALASRGATQAWLSLSHEAGMAAAVCVVE